MVTVNIAVRDCHLLVAVFSLLDGGVSTLGSRVTVSWTTEMPHYFKDSEYNMLGRIMATIITSVGMVEMQP